MNQELKKTTEQAIIKMLSLLSFDEVMAIDSGLEEAYDKGEISVEEFYEILKNVTSITDTRTPIIEPSVPDFSDASAFLKEIIDEEKAREAIAKKLDTFESFNDKMLFGFLLKDAFGMIVTMERMKNQSKNTKS